MSSAESWEVTGSGCSTWAPCHGGGGAAGGVPGVVAELVVVCVVLSLVVPLVSLTGLMSDCVTGVLLQPATV